MAWWFNLNTQAVEEGEGDPNSQRLGPYETQQEAAGVLDRMRQRNETWDEQDRWPGEPGGSAAQE
jgi:hypothetical protein